MTINFLPATSAHTETLIVMMRELYVYDHSAFHEDTHRSALAQMLADPACGRIWLIQADGNIVGYIVLTIGFSLEFHGHDGFLDELFVREPFRGQGIGTQAIAFIETQAKVLGISALHLEVEHANTKAQQVYAANGYQNHTRHLMTKWL
jgi:GNAT superfamily N-acetyltransferase